MTRLFAALALAATVAAAATLAHGASFSAWSPAVNLEAVPGTSSDLNTAALEGCPSPSRDGLRLYIASNRPGGQGNLDIWVAERASTDDAFGAPVNLGPAINTAGREFCPTPTRDGHGLLFVSDRPGGCGGSDIYVTRHHVRDGWSTPENVGCGVNSAADEASPFLVEDDSGTVSLYFSSARAGGFAPDSPGAVVGDSDIYASAVAAEGSFSTPTLVPGVNTANEDARPNVRRDGLELFFDSNRSGGLGSFDIWTSTRTTRSEPWSAAENLGANVNSAASETRASLSWDRTILYFGSTREGSEPAAPVVPSQDVYFSTREKGT